MTKTITLNHITKIEGHASLNLGIEKNNVTKCELSATEGARYFEGIVLGRNYYEAHELTSRICGICSCAHVIAAISAVEDAIGFEPSKQTVQLRELLTLGERIRSHATHLYFLALPDYVGYESALAMAKKYRSELGNALQLMKIGNHIIKVLGARELHPVSAAVGGWLKLPQKKALDEVQEQLETAREAAKKTCDLFFSLTYPSFSSQGTWFSLKDKKHYAMLEGVFASPEDQFQKSEYQSFIHEYHTEHSNSNFVVKDAHRYMVGALSRINNNHTQLAKAARKELKRSMLSTPSKNPYHNVLAQAIEIVHCVDQAIELCNKIPCTPEKFEHVKPSSGTGIGCIEVPRGTLWHEYRLDSKGRITHANIITPTAQNLLNIQEDIRALVPHIVKKKKKDMIMDIEKLIRSYDPCFSCSAHFLEVNWI